MVAPANFTIKWNRCFVPYPLKAPLGFAVELLCWHWKWSLCFKVNKKGRAENIQFKRIITWPTDNKYNCRSGRILLLTRKKGEEKIRGKCVKGLKLINSSNFLTTFPNKHILFLEHFDTVLSPPPSRRKAHEAEDPALLLAERLTRLCKGATSTDHRDRQLCTHTFVLQRKSCNYWSWDIQHLRVQWLVGLPKPARAQRV